jgi:CheY-like chemotaxis protein
LLPDLSTGWGGVFLNTEVDFEDGMTLTLESQLPSAENYSLKTSISLPNLVAPRTVTKSDDTPSPVEMKAMPEPPLKASRKDSQTLATRRHQRLMKSVGTVMPGKSVLTLTDKKELRKQIARVLVADDTAVSFIKSTSELWQRLRDAKENYDILLLDLTKSELQVEAIVRTIRSMEKYMHLPIVVLSGDRDLSDFVKNSCSFVVFLPLAPGMLREALVWCFDRKSAQKLFQLEPQEIQMIRGKGSMSVPVLPDAVCVA